MSYYNFLEYIFTPISYFIDWLKAITNSLLSNYIFITFLGLTLFVSLFWFFFDTIYNLIESKYRKYEDFNNRFADYKEFKEVQYKYLDKYRIQEFEHKYNLKVMNEQVMSKLLHFNKDLLLYNTRAKLYLHSDAYYGDVGFDTDSVAYRNKVYTKVLDEQYNEDFNNYEIGRRGKNAVINIKAGQVANDILEKERENALKEKYTKKIVNNTPLTKEEEEEFEDLLENF